MNLTNTEALANLRDIHLPDAVSFWPPAPGWWIAIGSVLLLAAILYWGLRARRRSLRRAALIELSEIAEHHESDAEASTLALQLTMLLRRVAIARFPRRDVASLYGEDWLQFLSRTSGRKNLPREPMLSLMQAVYAAPGANASGSLTHHWIGAVRHWIRENT